MCHGAPTDTEWMATEEATRREAALLAFLEEHAKAPPRENRDIATYLAGMAPQKNQ
jgi:hypothetical protein